VPVIDTAVDAAVSMVDAQTQVVVKTVNASTSHFPVPGLGSRTAATQGLTCVKTKASDMAHACTHDGLTGHHSLNTRHGPQDSDILRQAAAGQ